jgi:hypothetical protein
VDLDITSFATVNLYTMPVNKNIFDPSLFSYREGVQWIRDAQVWFIQNHGIRQVANYKLKLLPGSDGLTWDDFDRLSDATRRSYSVLSIPENPALLDTVQYLFEKVRAHRDEDLLNQYEDLQIRALKNRARSFADSAPTTTPRAQPQSTFDPAYLMSVANHLWNGGGRKKYNRHNLRVEFTTAIGDQLPHDISRMDPLVLGHERTIVIITDSLKSLPKETIDWAVRYFALWGYGQFRTGRLDHGAQLMLALASEDGNLEALLNIFTTLLPRHLTEAIIPLMSNDFSDSEAIEFFMGKAAKLIRNFKWPEAIKKTYSKLHREQYSDLMLTAVPHAWYRTWQKELDAIAEKLNEADSEEKLLLAEEELFVLDRRIVRQVEAIEARYKKWLNRATIKDPNILHTMRDELHTLRKERFAVAFDALDHTANKLELYDEDEDEDEENVQVLNSPTVTASPTSVKNPNAPITGAPQQGVQATFNRYLTDTKTTIGRFIKALSKT